MRKQLKFAIIIMLVIWVTLLLYFLLRGSNIAILNPKGIIAIKQRNLIFTAAMLSLFVIIPVFTMTFGFAWKYRANNKKAKYSPDWDQSKIAETIWWGGPIILISILSVITWNSSYDLDPFKKLDSNIKPITVQVIALDWKWLFIYPQQNIATVNYLQIPVNTPINFEITSDAPMNSFWIPQLGGQIYAMAGMKSQLHLSANQIGEFQGSSANISGRGFSGMTFNTKSTSMSDFNTWVGEVKSSRDNLDVSAYKTLAMQSENDPIKYYASSQPGIYDKVIMKFKSPHPELSDSTNHNFGSNIEPESHH